MFDLISSAHAVATTVTATAKVTAGGTTVAAANAPWWDMPDSLATLLGSFGGAFFGLLAILGGALYNARLNRERDDRLRGEDRKALAAALKAELTAMRASAAAIAKTFREDKEGINSLLSAPTMFFKYRPLGVFSAATDRIGILADPETINAIAAIHLEYKECFEGFTETFETLRKADPIHQTEQAGVLFRRLVVERLGDTLSQSGRTILRLEKIERGEDPDTAVVPDEPVKEEEAGGG